MENPKTYASDGSSIEKQEQEQEQEQEIEREAEERGDTF
jgi:hypothetical protein